MNLFTENTCGQLYLNCINWYGNIFWGFFTTYTNVIMFNADKLIAQS